MAGGGLQKGIIGGYIVMGSDKDYRGNMGLYGDERIPNALKPD